MPTALVTGASRGLGLEWCRQLSEGGYRVLAACRSGKAAESLKGLEVEPLSLDISSKESVDALAKILENETIDLLVNNAGIRPEECGPDKTISEFDFEAMSLTLDTNCVGAMRVLVASLPALAKSKAFKVVNVSSALGSIEFVTHTRDWFANLKATDLAYRSSKAALNMATACAALELAEKYPGAVVVAMDPGYASTDMGTRNGIDKPPMTPAESVSAQIEIATKLTPAQNGKFIKFDGSVVPW